MAIRSPRKRALDVVMHDAEYRVLIVRNDRPAHADDSIHAICLEQDLIGRGRNVAAAMSDLSDTMIESLTAELRDSIPEYRKPPDAALLAAFQGRTTDYDNMPVLRRLHAFLRIQGANGAGKSVRLKPQSMTFRPEPVAA